MDLCEWYMHKVVAMKVKPYELVSKEEDKVIEKTVENETENVDEKDIDMVEDYETVAKEEREFFWEANKLKLVEIRSDREF